MTVDSPTTTTIDLDQFKAHQYGALEWISKDSLAVYNHQHIYIFNLRLLRDSQSRTVPRLLVPYRRDQFDGEMPEGGGGGAFVRVCPIRGSTEERIAILTSHGTITVWRIDWAQDHFCPLPGLIPLGNPVSLDNGSLVIDLLTDNNQRIFALTQNHHNHGSMKLCEIISKNCTQLSCHIQGRITFAELIEINEKTNSFKLLIGCGTDGRILMVEGGGTSTNSSSSTSTNSNIHVIVNDGILGGFVARLLHISADLVAVAKFNRLYLIDVPGRAVRASVKVADSIGETRMIVGLFRMVEAEAAAVVCIMDDGSYWRIIDHARDNCVQSRLEADALPWRLTRPPPTGIMTKGHDDSNAGSSSDPSSSSSGESDEETTAEATDEATEPGTNLPKICHVTGVAVLPETHSIAIIQHYPLKTMIDRLSIYQL